MHTLALIDKRTSLRKICNKEVKRRGMWTRRVGIVRKLQVFRRQYQARKSKRLVVVENMELENELAFFWARSRCEGQ